MRVFLFLFLFGVAASSSATMSRVVGVQDSRTILVEFAGRRSVVVLNGVAVVAADEASAADFLRRLLAGAWVLVEGGEVYRSPDALYINGEMIRHAWRTASNMRYLGESDPGPRTSAAAAAPRKPKRVSTPARPRSRSARRARR